MKVMPGAGARLVVLSFGLMSCGRPPYVVLTLEDPRGAASSSSVIHVESGELQQDFDRAGRGFPLTLTVAARDRETTRELRIEARDATRVLARGRVTLAFATGQPKTAVVRLAAPCTRDEDCGEGDFCEVDTCSACPALDDGNACTLDRCQGPSGVVHLPDFERNGGGCTLAEGGLGLCQSGECIASLCGDGLVDARTELCDDQNQNPNDGCHACALSPWRTVVLSGLGVSRGEPDAQLLSPVSVTVDGQGNVFVLSGGRIFRIDTAAGIITPFAGSPSSGELQWTDGAPATSARFGEAEIAADLVGNLYVAAPREGVVLRVDHDTGLIRRVAGTGAQSGALGDGGPATAAYVWPKGIAVDGLGHLYIADFANSRIRRVDATTGVITTVAGNGQPYSRDGRPADQLGIPAPLSVAVDDAGNMVFNGQVTRLFRVDAATGQLSTIAGTGEFVSGPLSRLENVPATSVPIRPQALLLDPQGDVYFSEGTSVFDDPIRSRIRRISGGMLSTVPGSTIGDFDPVGAPAIYTMAFDPRGDLVIGNTGRNVVTRFDLERGTFTDLAGATDCCSGIGGLATGLSIIGFGPMGVNRNGDVYIGGEGCRTYRVDAATGFLSVAAGSGRCGFDGDGGPASSAVFSPTGAAAFDAAGHLYLAGSYRIRRVDAATQRVSTVAGNGVMGQSGDGGPATSASLPWIESMAFEGSRRLYFVSDHRVRQVDLELGVISVVAGGTTPGFAGDGEPATRALLDRPSDVAVDSNGNLYIADTGNRRVRRVDRATGLIETVAGDGSEGPATLGASARGRPLGPPLAIQVDARNQVFITEIVRLGGNQSYRVLRIDPSGVIRAVTGLEPRGTDGSPAEDVKLRNWAKLALDGAGNLFLGEQLVGVRRIDAASGVITTVAGSVHPEGDGLLEASRLGAPAALVEHVDPDNGERRWIVADGATGRLRAVDLERGRVTTLAGYPEGAEQGPAGFSRLFDDASGIALDSARGRLYVSEARGHTLRVLEKQAFEWMARPFAGQRGAAGHRDGALADSRFHTPRGLWFDDVERTLYVADGGNHVIRAIRVDDTPPTVTTFAGQPRRRGFRGDGEARQDALFNGPEAITRAADGSFYVADTQNHRVRRIDSSGRIDTVLGDGSAASSGIGAPARLFPVDHPTGVAVDRFGNLFVTSRNTVRRVSAGGDGVATGADEVSMVYGEAPREAFPASVTRCLSGLAFVRDERLDDSRLLVLDACLGFLLALDRM